MKSDKARKSGYGKSKNKMRCGAHPAHIIRTAAWQVSVVDNKADT